MDRERGGRKFLEKKGKRKFLLGKNREGKKRIGKEKEKKERKKERMKEGKNEKGKGGWPAGPRRLRPEMAGSGRRWRPRLQAQAIKWGASIVHFEFSEF